MVQLVSNIFANNFTIMNSSKIVPISIILMLVSIVMIPNFAISQNNENKTIKDSTKQLEKVIVTAQKRAEYLQKIPLAVSSLDAKQIKALQILDIKDLSSIIPNTYSADPGDARNATSIRGIATTSYDPTVAVYIDGVNQFSLDTYIPNLYDIARIEVLRGPQGTLYGRNSMGGVINIITKEPTNQTNGFGEISIGDYNQQRINAGFKTPFLKDKLFFGMSALYEARDGYYKNDFNNLSYDKQNGFSSNYFLNWLISKKWSAKLKENNRSQKNSGAFPLVTDLNEAINNPYRLNQNAVTKMIDNTLNNSLSLNYIGTYFNFNSQTAYQSNYRYYTNPIDGDFSPYDIISVKNNFGKDWNNIKVLTQELKFTSINNLNSKFKWTTGAYLFYQDAPVKQATHFGEFASMMVGDSLFSLTNITKTIKKGIAIYGQLSYAIQPNFTINLGLRNDYEQVTQSVLGLYQHAPDNTEYTTTPETSAKINFNALSPKVSLDYQVNNNSLTYILFSRGFRTGGLSPLGSDPSQPPLIGYKPEYSNNFELGMKNEMFNRTLRFNIALFYTKIADAQVPSLVLPDAVTITKNIGKLNSKGIEAEVLSRPVKGLMLLYNFGYTNAKFETLNLSQQGSSVDLSGKNQIFTPDITSFLAAQYNHKISTSKIDAFIRAEWKYTGTTYFDLANNIYQSPYSIINMSVGVSNEKYGVKLWSRNLTKQKYISYAYDFGAVHLGDPAHIGITVSYQF